MALKFPIDSFTNLKIIGIVTFMPDYQLAYALNNTLNINLIKHENMVCDSQFSYYCEQVDETITYNLIANRQDGMVIDKAFGKIDFLFIVRKNVSETQLNSFLQTIKSINTISYAKIIDYTTLNEIPVSVASSKQTTLLENDLFFESTVPQSPEKVNNTSAEKQLARKIEKFKKAVVDLQYCLDNHEWYIDRINKSPKIEQLVNLLHQGDYSCVIHNLSRNTMNTYTGRGVSDLYQIYCDDPKLLDEASIADKVVGKGAAALMCLGQVLQVYADVISRPALTLLQDNYIKVAYNQLVEHIYNRDNTDYCPLEKLCEGLNDLDQMFLRIETFINQQRIK